MKHIYILGAALLLSVTLLAVPAKRTKQTVTLTDGSSITAIVCGDENGMLYIAQDGRRLHQQADGRFSYEEPSASSMVPSSIRPPYGIGRLETSPLPSKGDVQVPVVLVQFADREFMESDATKLVESYDLYFNGENYTGHGSVSSVRDYFIHESDSLFKPNFTILGPVVLDKGYAYYGADGGGRIDVNYSLFRSEALTKLTASNPDLDWTYFDNGGNGKVDMVFFIFAGTGQNNTHIADELWPKESTVSTVINGITFETSALCNEAQDGQLDGIGVVVHEFMHALGVPDFYDTKNGSVPVYGMDMFSVMDYGEYNNNGYRPSGLTAYERDFLQWRKLVELTEEGTYTLRPVNERGAVGYKIVNALNPDEYYVLEYRAKTGNDYVLGRFAEGMTVTHVDYKMSAWEDNTLNTSPSHQRMTLLPASGDMFGIGWVNSQEDVRKYIADLACVPFPGSAGVCELTNESSPYPATVFTGQFMSKPIYNIREDKEAQTVTFDFLKPNDNDGITPAVASAASEVFCTVDGLRITGRPQRSGLYIVNGRKVLVK